MDLTIIGSGNMARGIGSRALAGGHGVTVVAKDEEHAQEARKTIGESAEVVVGGPVEGDVVALAVYYPDAREAVEQHADELAGKVVVDVTNPTRGPSRCMKRPKL